MGMPRSKHAKQFYRAAEQRWEDAEFLLEMAVKILGDVDPVTESYASSLQTYAASHPSTSVDVYRHTPVAVRVRIIDPDFRGKTRSERHKTVWPILYTLDQDKLDELGMLLLITPEEKDTSTVNREFDVGWFAKDYSKALQSTQGKTGVE
jgi:stress-induced morphogen